MSLTCWLIAVADCSCVQSKLPPEKKISARATILCLESESGLITHGDAIEHVTRRGGSVSLGAFMKTANRLRPENLCGDRRCKAPFSFGIRRHRYGRRALESDTSRLGLLINLDCNYGGTKQARRDGSGIGGLRTTV